MNETADVADLHERDAELPESEQRQCLLAMVADELYAFDLLSIKEILRTSQKERAPGAPDFVAGLINLRGEIVTVLDAARLLGIDAGERSLDDESSIVVLEGNAQTIGIQVESLEEVIAYDPAAIQPSDIDQQREGEDYIAGLISLDSGKLVILMDTDALCDG